MDTKIETVIELVQADMPDVTDEAIWAIVDNMPEHVLQTAAVEEIAEWVKERLQS